MDTSGLYGYMEEHSSPEPEWLYELNRRTNLRLLNGRMCSGPLQGRFLSMLTAMIRPSRALELGTFSGYSALCIAEVLAPGASLDTIEADDELEDFIREAFASVPPEIAAKIRLHIGPALDILPRFPDETFDFAFIDASKREYPDYYRAILPKIATGGFIAVDNTLWDGHIVDSAYSRDPQTKGVALFNDIVRADPNVEKVMLPLRDGITLIHKKHPSASIR